MKVTKCENGVTIISAGYGLTLRRLSDGQDAGSPIYLGIDYSTGVPREDLPEYYEEVEIIEEILE